MKEKYKKIVPIITLLTYLVMVLLNALANIIPINGKGTGEISDAYENLFAPTGLTFSIWGLIYLLLLGFTIYQFTYYRSKNKDNRQLIIKIGILFSISSIANSIWIVVWHYEYIFASLMMMSIILISLIVINLILRKKQFNHIEHMLIRLPFTVYFGWITVAFIANITIYLVSIGWNRLGLSEVFWTVLIIIVGALIGSVSAVFYKSISYANVLLWSYGGIAIKHLSSKSYNGEYISIIITVICSMTLLVLAELLVIKYKIRGKGVMGKGASYDK